MNVLITGATGGIGREIALSLSKSATLYITGRNEQELSELNELVLSQGGTATALPADISRPSERKEFCEKLKSRGTSFDWIIHAAGTIDPREATESLGMETTTALFEINTFAPIFLTNSLLPFMTKGGGILFIASTAGIWGNELFPLYAASKAALINFSKSLAKNKKFISNGQMAIALCPGPTNTKMRERIAQDASQQQSPKIIGEAVRKIFLRESSYKNGDILIVRNAQEFVFQEL